MPIYRGTVVALAVGASFKPDLKPNDRFGPRGGRARVRAKQTTSTGIIAETIFIGNDMVENRSVIPSDAAGQVDNFTPAVEAIGGTTEVVDVNYTNIGIAAATFNWVVEIENA